MREQERDGDTMRTLRNEELSHSERARVRVVRKKRMRVVASQGGGEHEN